MNRPLEDIEEIAARFPRLGPGMKRHLILIGALPGSGKTTVAKEIAGQTHGIHFDIDEVKRVVVASDKVAEEIDPPELRYRYYAETIRRLPELFQRSPTNIVIIDETFHLQEFRRMWDQAGRSLGLNVHWIEVTCTDEIVKDRLCIGKGREKHILGDKAFPMFLRFKEAFEPFIGPRYVVDNTRELFPQVQGIIENLGLDSTTPP